MARGGKRDGAGRPKGATNRLIMEAAEKVAETGQTPLDFLVERFRDPAEDMGKRIDAAKAAAQYVHPKLNAVDLTGQLDAHVKVSGALAWQLPQ